MKGNSEFRFKKKYGQNFLIDKNIIKKIISASDIDNNTVVIEIGAGSGVLTKELSQEAKYVLAYEIDKTLAPILERNLEECKNVNLIFDDFLKRNIEEDLKCYEYKKLILVANLPYYITTPIIKKIIDDKLNIQKIIIMVQKEVAERFTASPKTREYNSLSIFIDYYFSVKNYLLLEEKLYTNPQC